MSRMTFKFDFLGERGPLGFKKHGQDGRGVGGHSCGGELDAPLGEVELFGSDTGQGYVCPRDLI